MPSPRGKYFRKPFEDKGPMTRIMENVYSGLIACDDVALIGLSYMPLGGG
jgi:glucokinase